MKILYYKCVIAMLYPGANAISIQPSISQQGCLQEKKRIMARCPSYTLPL